MNKRILVTGGNGFLGSYVVDRLEQLDHKVDHPDRKRCNLLDEKNLYDYLSWLSPDIVMHLAAVVGGIGANKENPGKFFYENMQMGMNMIHAASRLGVGKFVFVGTTCSYPKFTPVPFKETDIWNGYPEETNAPYGIAKKALISMGNAYRQQYGLNFISLLPANLYGPKDNFDPSASHVIPALVRKFQEAKDNNSEGVTLWGTGSASREFLFVEDCARGICLATERYDKEESVNLGSGKEISIKEVATIIAEEIGYSGMIIWDSSKPDGQPRRCLDTSRAKEFGFEASKDFRTGVREVIAYWNQVKSS